MHSLRKVLLVSVALFLVFGNSNRSAAQGTMSIDGTVLDGSQAAIAGATVVLTNVDTSQARTTVSNGEGHYIFPALTAGHYKLSVQISGFSTWEQQNITLSVGQQLTLSPQLQVGSESFKVEVTTAPPAIATSNSNISDVVDAQRIEQLPLNGRNVLQLVALAPGVVSTGQKGQFGATQTSYASSGGRDIDSNYTLDGGYNINTFYAIPNPYPNPDSMQEFSVDSRNYSAKFGRGSTDVSALTRSGTNSFHGSVFEFLRNTALDARPYFSPTVPTFHRNQFGGTIGGPIKKNKLFVFLGYQGTQQSGGPGNQTYTTVPMQERTGDFSDISTPIIDPLTGTQFPGNVIPHDRIAAQATAFYQQYLPAPNLGLSTFSFPNVGTLTEKQGIAKVDWQISNSDSAFVRYFMDDIPQVAYGNGSGSALDVTWLGDLPTRFQSTTVGEVHTFSSHLINDFHFTYTRSSFGLIPRLNFSLAGLGYDVNTDNAFTQYGLVPDASISLTGAFTGYVGAPTRDIAPTTQITDNVFWIKGNHSINVGFEIYRNRINETQNYRTGGALTFSGQITGTAASDFLLGKFSNYQQIGGLTAHLHQMLPSFYVQDDIKLTRNLTLGVGVRWDITSGYHSENGQLLTFQPGRQSTVFPLATPGLLFAGDPGVPDDIVGIRWNNLAPRIGLAWDVFGTGATSLRAGFGTYYVPLTRGISLNRLTLIQPFTLQVNLSGGDTSNIFAQAPFNGVNPFPIPQATDHDGLARQPFFPTASESSVTSGAKTETNYEWSLSLQQLLWKKSVLEMNYIGLSSSHLVTSLESNPARYIPGASTVANTQSRRIYPDIGSINSTSNNMSANYNALQVQFTLPPVKGVSVKSAYTWSRALGVVAAEAEGTNGPRNPNNYNMDYAPLPFDVNQNSVTSFFWQPFSVKLTSSPLIRHAAQGWQLGGILTFSSGTPLNLVSGIDNSFTGIGQDTPDVVGAWSLPSGRSKPDQIAKWFNPAAFTRNAVGTFGTLPVNALRNPGIMNFDLNIQKNFVFTEKYRAEFRSSLYNSFNHTNLGSPVNSLASANFGKIQTAADPRVIEFGLRLLF